MARVQMISEKQIAFIEKLAKERDLTSLDTHTQAAAQDETHKYKLSMREASDLIGLLLRCKPLPQAQQPKEAHKFLTQDGMYIDRKSQTIYKVQFNKASGDGRRLYAKRLEVDDFGNGEYKVRFVYEAGALKKLNPEDKMTLEEAKAFGALYGTCCRCGRTLTREESIERAMGPVCAGYFA